MEYPPATLAISSLRSLQQLRWNSASTLAFQLLKIGTPARFVKTLTLKYELNTLIFLVHH